MREGHLIGRRLVVKFVRGISVIAPRMFFRERGKSMRSEAVTGSFTGTAGVDEGAIAPCAHPELIETHTTKSVTRMRFIEISFTCLILILNSDFASCYDLAASAAAPNFQNKYHAATITIAVVRFTLLFEENPMPSSTIVQITITSSAEAMT